MAEGGTYNVGDLVAEFLSRVGVSTCFGIISVHNIPMLDGIGRRNAIRYVMARGEMGGAHMADAYARVSGHLGVLFSSTGPGAANAVPGLAEARFAGSPVLHITGQTPTKFLDRDMGTVHDLPGQAAMLGAVCKAVFRVRSAQEALGVLSSAAALALTPPRGPVSVEVPIDVQRTVIARPAAALDALVLPVPPPLPPSEAALDAAAEVLARARRPMLWLGNGAKEAGAAATKLLDLGFGAVSSWNGRGIVPEDHPMTFGGMHGNGSPRVQAFYRTCDAMLVVGSRLRGHETMEFALKLPETLVRVDVDPGADGRTYPSAAFVCGDAALAMEGLAARLRRSHGGRSGLRRRLRGNAAAGDGGVSGDARTLCRFPGGAAGRPAPRRALGAGRHHQQQLLGQPRLPGVRAAGCGASGERRDRAGAAARHRRGAGRRRAARRSPWWAMAASR